MFESLQGNCSLNHLVFCCHGPAGQVPQCSDNRCGWPGKKKELDHTHRCSRTLLEHLKIPPLKSAKTLPDGSSLNFSSTTNFSQPSRPYFPLFLYPFSFFSNLTSFFFRTNNYYLALRLTGIVANILLITWNIPDSIPSC